MAKKAKLKTPDWILEGYDSEDEYNKKKGVKKQKSGKTFKLRECPKCKSDDVRVVLGGDEGRGSHGWECRKCQWSGENVVERELTEDQFMEYLDKKGEPVA